MLSSIRQHLSRWLVRLKTSVITQYRNRELRFILKYFGYLLRDYGFSVVESDLPAPGGFPFEKVRLSNGDIWVGILIDRSDVELSVGTEHSPWKNKAAGFDLVPVIAYLTEGTYKFDYRMGTREQQIRRVSQVLKTFYPRIVEVLQPGALLESIDLLELWEKKYGYVSSRKKWFRS